MHRTKFEYDDVACHHDEVEVRHIGSLGVEPSLSVREYFRAFVGQIQRFVITKVNGVTSEDCDRLDLELWPTFWRISILYNPLTSKMESNN